jgi:hypothetical protein
MRDEWKKQGLSAKQLGRLQRAVGIGVTGYAVYAIGVSNPEASCRPLWLLRGLAKALGWYDCRLNALPFLLVGLYLLWESRKNSR